LVTLFAPFWYSGMLKFVFACQCTCHAGNKLKLACAGFWLSLKSFAPIFAYKDFALLKRNKLEWIDFIYVFIYLSTGMDLSLCIFGPVTFTLILICLTSKISQFILRWKINLLSSLKSFWFKYFFYWMAF